MRILVNLWAGAVNRVNLLGDAVRGRVKRCFDCGTVGSGVKLRA